MSDAVWITAIIAGTIIFIFLILVIAATKAAKYREGRRPYTDGFKAPVRESTSTPVQDKPEPRYGKRVEVDDEA